jgi:hypothetical protein
MLAFTGLISHYLFRDRFGRPGKGNDKGKAERLVKNGRRRFATPVPVAASLEALKAKLEADCLSELDRSASSCPETIGVRLQADLAAFRWRSGLNQVSVFLKISEPRPLVPLKQ